MVSVGVKPKPLTADALDLCREERPGCEPLSQRTLVPGVGSMPLWGAFFWGELWLVMSQGLVGTQILERHPRHPGLPQIPGRGHWDEDRQAGAQDSYAAGNRRYSLGS